MSSVGITRTRLSAATLAGVLLAFNYQASALPRSQDGFAVASIGFLRARAEQRPGNLRAVLFEYRFRLLAD